MEIVTAVGGALLSVSFEKLFDKLASPELRQFASKKEVRSQLQKWDKDLLPKIHAALEDAEEKQTTSRLVGIWLNELRDLVYDVDDILDKFATEALRLKLKNRQQAAPAAADITSCTRVTKCLPAKYFTGFKFNAEMSSKLKKITARLETVCAEKSRLDLGDKAVGGVRSGRSDDGTTRPPTTSLADSHVFGRDKDKQALLDLLLANEPIDGAATSCGGDAAVFVIPIQGMGGLGKTTLAQLLYNDDKVKVHFELRAWVCVSDTFDILWITKTIVESFGIETRDNMTLDQLQVKLGSILFGKKFLIVLDDVWNEKYEAWTILCKPFKGGAPGSKIVVTTRNLGVASIMSSRPAYHLSELVFDDCLSLFAQHALGVTNFDGHPDLKDVGEKIVSKCKGLPLAVKTLGGLLRTKLHRDEWLDILDNQIWDFPNDKSDILPALRLSYHHLPSQLKQCFAYCAIFPKDYEFDMYELVQLWMAEGFLSQSKGRKHLEDMGVAYFYDLLSRSFFQHSSEETAKFVMHDLIHDLALYVAGETCFHLVAKLERDEHPSTIQKVRHSSFTRCEYEVSGRFGIFGEGKGLRTLLALPVDDSSRYNDISYVALNEMMLKIKHLRALSLSSYRIRKVPESVSCLKHLRYMNLSRTAIRLLPEFVCSLLNLQTLLLRECEELEKLPTSIGSLSNLCHLDISGTYCLKDMPVGIANLSDLRTLGKFIVGVGGGDRLNIRELGGLSHLKGELYIQGLHNVEDFQHAREADLKGKKHLEKLVMEWKDNSDEKADLDVSTKVLELLQPHKNLRTLAIKFYSGREFPSWMGDPSLMSNIIELELCNCWKSTSLPSLGRLPVLNHLTIRGMKAVKTLGFEFYGCDSAFQALETLKFRDMLGWEKWCSSEEVEWKFPRLRELEILNCPLLIAECKISLPSLCQLKLKECNESLLRCMIGLSSLTTLSIGKMTGLSCLHQSVEQRYVNVEHLEMYQCEDLTSLWQSGAWIEENFKNLRSLKVRSCPQLVSFFTASSLGEEEVEESCEMPGDLVYLEIEDCCNLQKLPAEKMVSLETMIVKKCYKIGAIQIEKQQEEGNDEISTIPWKLRHIELEDCGGQFTESMVNGLMMRLQGGGVLDHLEIVSCDSIQHLGIKGRKGGSIVHTKLKRLRIKDCKNLVSLRNSEEWMADQGEDIGSINNMVEIEFLCIENCPSLMTDGMKLPVGSAVKSVWVEQCSQLESLPEECIMSTSSSSTSSVVECQDIVIMECPNLQRLPDSLHCLTNLTSLRLNGCDGIKWFPEIGLPIPNLKSLEINNCRNLRSLPKNMHSLTSLEKLSIGLCPGVEFFIEEQGCLPPPNLVHLTIRYCPNMKQSMSEWGLHTLTSLQSLSIGAVPKVPEDEATLTSTLQLPATLKELYIRGFNKVESITSSSWGIQNLTSLTRLSLWDCPKLKYLPKEGLPPTLERLYFINCPIVAKKCSEGKGKYWPRISLIPFIHIPDY